MRTVLFCLVVSALGLVSLQAMQSPIIPPPEEHPREGEYAVIVQGCVQGTRLKRLEGVPDRAGDFFGVSDWVLTGSPEVMRQLRETFDTHHVEVIGTVVLPQTVHPRQTDVSTRRLPDGTSVRMTSRRSDERWFFPPRGESVPVRLAVTSVRMIAERCG